MGRWTRDGTGDGGKGLVSVGPAEESSLLNLF